MVVSYQHDAFFACRHRTYDPKQGHGVSHRIIDIVIFNFILP